MTSKLAAFILLFAVSVTTAQTTVELWKQAEFSFHSSKHYENPFLQVNLKAVFTNASGDTISRPAFWDGGNTWKIRFAPTKTGRWEFKLQCNITDDAGLNNQTGFVDAVEYKGNLPIYRNGFLKISPNKHYFVYNNEVPFFYLADTHWFLPLEKWDECNAPGCKSQFRFMADKRLSQGFNVYQVQTNGINLVEDSVTSVDIEAFRDIDRKFDYLSEKGFVINTSIGSAHSFAQILGIKGAERLAKYWAARYGAYPVIWMTGQEVDLDKHKYLDVWKAAARTIHQFDDYHHPHSAHLWDNNVVSIFDEEPWHNFHMTQGGHIIWGGGTQTKEHYEKYWEHTPVKPILESEANYEELGKDKKCTAMDTRNAAYKSILCGSLGFGYGAQGIWEDCYTPTDCGCCQEWGTKFWYDALNMKGGYQMQHLTKFFTSFEWYKLEPRFDNKDWMEINTSPDKEREKFVLSTISNKQYVLYIYSANSYNVVLKNLDKNLKYKARWFDPREGTFIKINKSLKKGIANWRIPEKPTAEDYILLLCSE